MALQLQGSHRAVDRDHQGPGRTVTVEMGRNEDMGCLARRRDEGNGRESDRRHRILHEVTGWTVTE